jgi:hypothetical protein
MQEKTVNKSARFPAELAERIDKSMEKMKQARGKKPSFTDWMVEAAAEKLAREDKQVSA